MIHKRAAITATRTPTLLRSSMISPSFTADSVYPHCLNWSQDGVLVATSGSSVKLLMPALSTHCRLTSPNSIYSMREVCLVGEDFIVRKDGGAYRKRGATRVSSSSQLNAEDLDGWLGRDDYTYTSTGLCDKLPLSFRQSALGPHGAAVVSVPPQSCQDWSLPSCGGEGDMSLAVLCSEGSLLLFRPKSHLGISSLPLHNTCISRLRMTGMELMGYLWHNSSAGAPPAPVGYATSPHVPSCSPTPPLRISAMAWFSRRFHFPFLRDSSGGAGRNEGGEERDMVVSVLATTCRSRVCLWGVDLSADSVTVAQPVQEEVDRCVRLLGSYDIGAAAGAGAGAAGSLTSVACVCVGETSSRSEGACVGVVVVGTGSGQVLEFEVTGPSENSNGGEELLCFRLVHCSVITGGAVETLHVSSREQTEAIDEQVVVACTSRGNGMLLKWPTEQWGQGQSAERHMVQMQSDVSGLALLHFPTLSSPRDALSCDAVVFSTLSGGVYMASVPNRNDTTIISTITDKCPSSQYSVLVQPEGYRVVGLSVDPLGILLCTVDLLDASHSDCHSLFHRKEENRQRVALHLLPSQQKLVHCDSGGGGGAEASAAMVSVLRRILSVLNTGADAGTFMLSEDNAKVGSSWRKAGRFVSLSSWMMMLLKVAQSTSSRKRRRMSEHDDDTEDDEDNGDDGSGGEEEDSEGDAPALTRDCSSVLLRPQEWERRRAPKLLSLVETAAQEVFRGVFPAALVEEVSVLSPHPPLSPCPQSVMEHQVSLLQCMHGAVWCLERAKVFKENSGLNGHLDPSTDRVAGEAAGKLQRLVDGAWASRVLLRAFSHFCFATVASQLDALLPLSLAALSPLDLRLKRSDLLNFLKRKQCRVPSFSELRSVIQMIHFGGAGGTNCVSDGERWGHMYVSESGEGGGHGDRTAFASAFARPGDFLAFLEVLCTVLHFDAAEISLSSPLSPATVVVSSRDSHCRVQQGLSSALCLQCLAPLPLSPDLHPARAGGEGGLSLRCVSCSFVTQRCMYTRLPLFEGTAAVSATAVTNFRRCHLCKSASFCGQFPPLNGDRGGAFAWLPYEQFNALLNSCLYCGVLLVDVI